MRSSMNQIPRPNTKVLQALGAMSDQAAEFKLKPGVVLAGAGCGVLLGAAGVGLVADALRTAGHPLWCLLGLGLLGAGAGLLLLVKRLTSLRVWVTPRGLILVTLGTGDSCRCFRVESAEPAEREALAATPDISPSPQEAAPAVRPAVSCLRGFSNRLVQRVT
jgi:hypothetical protein